MVNSASAMGSDNCPVVQRKFGARWLLRLGCAVFLSVSMLSGAALLPVEAVIAVPSAQALPLTPHHQDGDDDEDWEEDYDGPPLNDNGDGPLHRYLCHLGIGRGTRPFSDAIAEYVWATDFNDADRIVRENHPMTPPWRYIAWSRCDPA